MLLQSIGSENEIFERKKMLIDTAMINLNLPVPMKIQARSQLYMFHPLEQSQEEIKILMSLLTPS